MTADSGTRSGGWKRFLFGFIAPFVAPFLITVFLGGVAPTWAYGGGFVLLFVIGLAAGWKDKKWGFLLGVVSAFIAFFAFVALVRAGYVSLP